MKLQRLIAALVLFSLPSLAGVVFEIEVKDHDQSPPKTESIQAAVEGRQLKMDVSSKGKGKQGKMIFRGERKEMVVVDHDNKTYHVIDEAGVKDIAGKVSEAAKTARDALKNLPEDPFKNLSPELLKNLPPEARKRMEEARKRMEKIRKEAGAGGGATPARSKPVYRKTTLRKTMGKWPCVRYDVLVEKQKVRELWVTDWGNVVGGKQAAVPFKEFAAFGETMRNAFGQIPGAQPDARGWEMFNEIDGFPVVTREFADDGGLESESTLRSARRQTLDPDAFEPPSGYKRQEMFAPPPVKIK